MATWSKSLADGFCQARRTDLLRPFADKFFTSSGGVRSTAAGGVTVCSVIFTVDFPDVLFPDLSVAVKVTVVTPTGKSSGASVVIDGERSTMSLAIAPSRKSLSCGSVLGRPAARMESRCVLPATERTSGAGTVSTGGVVSAIETRNGIDEALPLESLALQVTVVLPSGKRLFEAGAQETAPIGPSTRSTAVGAA